MPSIPLSGPAVEPVTLGEAKAYLRVEHDADDDVIAALIAGARVHVEAQTRRALITQSWRLIRDAWPADGRVAVLPCRSASSSPHGFIGSTARRRRSKLRASSLSRRRRPRCCPISTARRPRPGSELDVEVGHGDAPSDLPADLRPLQRIWRPIYALELSLLECPGFALTLLHALWTGHDAGINGFVNLSALLMRYFGARFGVLGIYVTGRAREKQASATGEVPPTLVGELLKAVAKNKKK